jgi:transposase
MKSDVDFAEMAAEITYLKQKVQHLEEQLRLARHHRFGASSEKTPPDQLSLFSGSPQNPQILWGEFNEAETEADPAALEPDTDQAVPRRRKQKGKRDKDFSGLPTEQIVHELPENERVCPDCGGPMHACGQALLRRELTVIPAQYKVMEHIQMAYACRNCEQKSNKTPMKKASVPAPVIKNSGICSPSLLAQILYNKYVLALPLYRQEQDLKRLGINLSRQNMANWVIAAHELYFKQIFTLLHQDLLRNEHLHADESTVQVLHENGRKAQTKSYMWLYRTIESAKHPAVLFDYKPSRAGECAAHFLEGFKGYLHTDGYTGYHSKLPDEITVVGCWAHMRRYLTDTLKILEEEVRPLHPANKGLGLCNRLFALEREFKKQGFSPEERYRARQEQAKPIAKEFFAWAKREYDQILLPESTFGEALTYACNQKKWLLRYLDDGNLDISNNLVERSVRPYAVGRRNWLFCNVPAGADASAAVYSIVETAKADGLKPFDYLLFLLERLPQRVAPEDCLPWGTLAQELCGA